MIVYTHNNSSRLQYILDFIAKEINTGPVSVTCSLAEFTAANGIKINYSPERFSGNEYWIKPHPLLFETEIREQPIRCFALDHAKAFFETGGDCSFDIFAACFYLLSRYEEYLPHSKDKYGRYAFENSLASREGFLHLPLVNIWLKRFGFDLAAKFGLEAGHHRPGPGPRMLPTYDIDIAWSYKHKGWWRNAGGWLRSVLKGDAVAARNRLRVLRGKEKDPFDCFDWLNQLHEKYQLKPYYFFLVPGKRGRYDKNISPDCPAMKDLIRDHVNRYSIGIHPSWKSGDDVSMLKEEIDRLSLLAGDRIVSSRQHYIRFNLPDGYRTLIKNGIKFDFSMGYGSVNGFRASVCSPYYWYDLEKEEQTNLLLFPFCFMEANSFYEQHYDARQALEEMREYYAAVREVNGYFIMIWHNSFLGTDKLYEGWREVYDQFIGEVSEGVSTTETAVV